MNSITVAGQLGKDAELKYMASGDAVASFSVADSQGKDKQGKDKPPIWWRCSLFGKRAETLAQYLKTGQAVTVSGNVTERSYEKDGETKTTREVTVQDIALQGGRREAQGEQQDRPQQSSRPQPRPQQSRPPAPAAKGGFDDMDDSDVPFSDPMKCKAFCLCV